MQLVFADKNNIQNAGVQYILDSVIEELSKDPERRFIYVETSFFYKWWTSRDDTVHQKVQDLVQSGLFKNMLNESILFMPFC